MRTIPDWNTYFMRMLGPISSRSKDPNTQLGCVIAGADNNIRATGYNSFPRGVRDDVPERLERPEKYMWVEHAERNAIYAAARADGGLLGCKMYMGGLPCMDCGRALIQVGISELIYDAKKHEAWITPRYVPDFERVTTLLSEGNIRLTKWYDPEVA